jgi:uncharacterized membrane protein
VATIDTIWIAAAIALIYGYVAVVPGAYLIKFSRKIRDFIGG